MHKAKPFKLKNLEGISNQTLEIHFKLYQGYVNETNRLEERIAELRKNGKVDPHQMPVYSELKRRLGFEYNGMILHEYYFGNLQKGDGGHLNPQSSMAKAAGASFGSYDLWRADFSSVGEMRGVGWAICYQDPATGRLSNHWISLHQVGNVAGFNPVLVMDLWEHAYILDYSPAERAQYIEAFFANVDWSAVEQRLCKPRARAAQPSHAA